MINPSMYVLAPNENWICDRFVKEWDGWYENSVKTPYDADVVWLLADWCADIQFIKNTLIYNRKAKFIVTIHHIVPEKFDEKQKKDFSDRDVYVHSYHVPCKKTHDQIRNLTDKHIFIMPFWVNQNIWNKSTFSKDELRENMGIDKNCFLVGSFQRDTEGSDLVSPKLEKGPDIFCDAVEILHAKKKQEGVNLKVLLSGWRRQYVMNRLNSAGIQYYYSELPLNNTINDFYNCLDLYIVASRYEGGPQAILECAATKTPIISTDVGVSQEILDPASIYNLETILDAKPNQEVAYKNVKKHFMPVGFNEFLDYFRTIK